MTRAGDGGLGLERLPDGVVQLTIRGRDKVNSLNEQDHRDLAGFWGSLADYMGVRFHDQPAGVLTGATMPGTGWFPGGTLNFAEHALAGPPEATVLVSRSERRPRIELTRGELRARVASLRAALQGLGVGPGDRVAAYLPSIPEALITLYAAASLGAIFTCCAPESGTRSVISRIGQVEPAVLVTVDGYVYGGQRYDRTAEVAAIRAAVPSIRATIAVPYLEPVTASSGTGIPDALDWNDLMARPADLEFTAVPFAHPLYIVYSSGTTGRPKAIIHGHGGVLLEHLKLFLLHDDLGPADRWFWYSSTNWMAWNYGASVLLGGGSLLTFDGHPMRPELADYWRMVGEEGVTSLGTSPGFLLACQKEGLVPGQTADLGALRTINSGGAPLTADGFRWVYRAVKPDVYLGSGSGGTDVASSFVSGCRLLPVRAGEIACPGRAALSAALAARIRSLLRAELSPRHQPDLVRQVGMIPRTLTGKRMEVPVKRVLLDPAAAAPAEPGEPDALAEFRDLERQLAAAGEQGTQQGTRQAGAPHAG